MDAVNGKEQLAIKALLIAALGMALAGISPARAAARNPASTQKSAGAGASSDAATPLPQGTKLVLKDGSFQLAREYHVEGDRVRYYSLDTHEWEEIPASLVDWDATRKAAVAGAKAQAAALAEVKRQEAERNPQILDVDASVEVAPGIFLPRGDGLFVFDGSHVQLVDQAATTTSISKTKAIEKVLVPAPIIPSRQSISIQGAHAKLRLESGQPEFYLRTADQREPDIELIRTEVHGKTRHIENIDQLFDQQSASAHVLPLQRWQVAIGLYRFTLGAALPPGEYAMVELVPGEGVSLYVWDFAVSGNAAEPKK